MPKTYTNLWTLYVQNKQKIWQKTHVAILPHQSSNDEQSTPLNLAKENPRLKSQSVNSSSAKGKGAIPTDGCWLAGRSAGSLCHTRARLFGPRSVRFRHFGHLQQRHNRCNQSNRHNTRWNNSSVHMLYLMNMWESMCCIEIKKKWTKGRISKKATCCFF